LFNNQVVLKSKFSSVDTELKKLASKMQHGLEKFNLTEEQKSAFF